MLGSLQYTNTSTDRRIGGWICRFTCQAIVIATHLSGWVTRSVSDVYSILRMSGPMDQYHPRVGSCCFRGPWAPWGCVVFFVIPVWFACRKYSLLHRTPTQTIRARCLCGTVFVRITFPGCRLSVFEYANSRCVLFRVR